MLKTDPYSSLRYPEFRYFIVAQFLFTVAILIQEVVLSYYLYELTGDPFALGLIGLAEAVPFISLALFGGYIADRYDRRKVYMLSFLIVALITLGLILFLSKNGIFHISDNSKPWVIYISVFIFGIARGFYGPAWSSLKPFLVKPEHYSNSASWSAQFWQIGRILGPVAGGFLFAYVGFINSLWVVVVILSLTIFCAFQISSKSIENQTKADFFESLKEGYYFVKGQKILWYSIVLDMFSVLFGGVIAMLPVFAKDILHVGAEGLGIMRASPAIGAVLVMLGTAFFPPTNRAWRNMLIAVAGFGVATLIFAVSQNFVLSCFALFLTGAFDSISVVIRSTILQMLPPDHLRGRVSAVNGVFVSASNELGAFESGLAAKIMGVVPSIIFGGIMTLGIVGYIFTQSKELFLVKLMKKG
ncbi:MAG: MFS transporter [Bacteroidetes bacterium]|nr:MFS transporter [Bacteroidota bacterium]